MEERKRVWELTSLDYPAVMSIRQDLVVRACYIVCHVWLCVTLWTVCCQAPLPMGFSREEYWSGLPWPSPGDLPDSGIKPTSLSPALAGVFFTTSATGEAQCYTSIKVYFSFILKLSCVCCVCFMLFLPLRSRWGIRSF